MEEKQKREVEEKVRREAEEKERTEREEKTRQEAEVKAKRDAEEKARLDAEARVKKEAEEKALAAEQRVREVADAKAKQEAELNVRREAEQAIRRQQAEQTKRDKEEKERLAAWEQAKRKAEEKLKQEAEEKARREAEDRIRIETKERVEREADEKLREAAKERARREIDEKERLEKETRIRKEAEEEVKREAKERAKREAEAVAERKSEEKASRKSESTVNRRQVKWGKVITMASLAVVVLFIAVLQFKSYDSRIPDLEKAASEQFQQPVKIQSVHLSLFPPHWRFDGVTVGNDSQIKAQQVNAAIDVSGVFGSGANFNTLVLESPVIKDEAIAWLIFGKPQGHGVKFAQLQAKNASFESSVISVPRFDAKADVAADGNWQKVVLEFSNKEVYVELHPGADRAQFEITANSLLPPFGGSVQFDDFSAKGTFGNRDMIISEFSGRSVGGSFSGNANLKWSGNWSIDGIVNAKQIDSAKLAPALLSGGRVDGKAAFVMQAKDAKTLFASPHVEGSFTIGQGAVQGVDLMHMLQGSPDSGKTGFRELTGNFVRDGENTQLRGVRMDAGILSANGTVELGASESLRGRFGTTSDGGRARGSLTLSGTVQVPKFGR